MAASSADRCTGRCRYRHCRSRGGLVDVANIEQMTGGASNISNLGDGISTKTLLNVQVIATRIRRAEIRIHSKQVDDPSAGNRFGQRGKDKLARTPDIYPRQRIGAGDGIDACWIVLHPKRPPILRAAQIEKRDHVGRVEEHAEAAANQRVGEALGLVGKAHPRAKALPELLINVGPVHTRDSETVGRRRIEAGQIVILAVVDFLGAERTRSRATFFGTLSVWPPFSAYDPHFVGDKPPGL